MLCSLYHLGTPGQPGWLYRLKVEEDIKVLTHKKQLNMALNKICKKVITPSGTPGAQTFAIPRYAGSVLLITHAGHTLLISKAGKYRPASVS